jgi:hypothetical protein
MEGSMRGSRLLLGLAPVVTMIGCAQPLPPTLSLDGRSCTAQPVLTGAPAVTLDDKTVTATLDASAACWQASAGPSSAYAVFELPKSQDSYIVSVISAPVGQGLFAPRVIMADREGNALREVSRDSFLFHGLTLQANLRVRPSEQYLIVASDPQSVGQDVSQIVGKIQTTAVPVGLGIVIVNTGSEATSTLTYAHSGIVKVSARPIPQVR